MPTLKTRYVLVATVLLLLNQACMTYQHFHISYISKTNSRFYARRWIFWISTSFQMFTWWKYMPDPDAQCTRFVKHTCCEGVWLFCGPYGCGGVVCRMRGAICVVWFAGCGVWNAQFNFRTSNLSVRPLFWSCRSRFIDRKTLCCIILCELTRIPRPVPRSL